MFDIWKTVDPRLVWMSQSQVIRATDREGGREKGWSEVVVWVSKASERLETPSGCEFVRSHQRARHHSTLFLQLSLSPLDSQEDVYGRFNLL